MSVKKVLLALVVLFGVAAFTAVSFSSTEAAKRPFYSPECVPINFFVEGYWGVYCVDGDNDIVSAELNTNSNHTLSWDNTYVQMIVELDDSTFINWSVCDASGKCVSGSYK